MLRDVPRILYWRIERQIVPQAVNDPNVQHIVQQKYAFECTYLQNPTLDEPLIVESYS